MKKKIASLLAVAAVFTAVPAFAATPGAADQPAFSQLSDKDNGDWSCCGRGGRGQGRNGDYCWGNQQQ